MIFLHAIHSMYSHYQALLENNSKWLFVLEYNGATIHFVNLFLKEHQFVYFNFDGSLERMGFSLPKDAQLLTLITEYSHRYYFNRLAITHSNLQQIAKLSVFTENQKRKKTSPYFFINYSAPSLMQNEAVVVNFPPAQEVACAPAQTTTVERGLKLEPPKPTPPVGLGNYVGEFYLTGERVNILKVRLNTWSEVEFAKSVRLLYEFYREEPKNHFTRKNLFNHAKLQQFTAAISKSTEGDILKVFNKFLRNNKFINQKNSILKSITTTDKEFPPDDQALKDLFEQFKEEHYKKRLPTDVPVIAIQQHAAKPVAVPLNKASINFIVSDADNTDKTEEYCSPR